METVKDKLNRAWKSVTTHTQVHPHAHTQLIPPDSLTIRLNYLWSLDDHKVFPCQQQTRAMEFRDPVCHPVWMNGLSVLYRNTGTLTLVSFSPSLSPFIFPPSPSLCTSFLLCVSRSLFRPLLLPLSLHLSLVLSFSQGKLPVSCQTRTLLRSCCSLRITAVNTEREKEPTHCSSGPVDHTAVYPET